MTLLHNLIIVVWFQRRRIQLQGWKLIAILCSKCISLELLWGQSVLHICEFQLVFHKGLRRSACTNGRHTFSDSLSILKLLKFPFYIYRNRQRIVHTQTHTHIRTNAVSPLKAAWNLCIFPSDFCTAYIFKIEFVWWFTAKNKYKRSILFPLHSLWREITIYSGGK